MSAAETLQLAWAPFFARRRDQETETTTVAVHPGAGEECHLQIHAEQHEDIRLSSQNQRINSHQQRFAFLAGSVAREDESRCAGAGEQMYQY
jgi:hypothetical protein